MSNINLTDNESVVLHSIARGEFEFFDGGFEADSDSWMDCLVDDAARALGISKQAAGGVISSMVQKGIFLSEGTGRDNAVFLTELAISSI